ncbi:MAG: sugar ABC transporter ATP-binding protein [Christensenellales bacterium]
MSAYVLETKGVSKSFFGTQVLFDVDFDVKPGEVHVLLGENGAGKSTLMKILSGAYNPDKGQIFVNGSEVQINGPRDSIKNGIGMVYQELSLIPYLNVVENIFLGNMPKKKSGFLDWKYATQKTKEIFEELDIDIDVQKPVNQFDLGIQQLIEIMRVLKEEVKLVILDEPTSSLSTTEVEKLFRSIRILKETGIAFVYITHKLEEVFEIGDRVTVLRDGYKIGETVGNIENLTQDDLITMMVGRKLENRFPKEPAITSDVLMKVEGLSDNKRFFDISFDLHRGEVLGISGLVGSGRSEMIEAIFGMRKITAGSISIHGEKHVPKGPRKAIENGIGLITKDRNTSLLQHMMIYQNIVIASLKSFVKGGFRIKRQEVKAAEGFIERLNIAAQSPFVRIRNLSGGNQQKVAIAKWDCSKVDVYLMDDPTRGVDIGAKAEVYRLINKITAGGAAIVLISSDMPELLGISDNIIVMQKGRIAAYAQTSECSQEFILEKAAGGKG